MESDLGKLFIGGISWDTDEERLREYFSQYGEVVEAVIMRDRATGRARGFGFVVFSDPGVAERVIMEKHVIDGRTVEAKKAVPKDDHQILSKNTSGIQNSHIAGRTKKIFVGGLPSSITESDFKMYFDQFGTITDVVVMYDHNTQRPRGFGFITFDSEEAVDRALRKTFHELSGKMVEVKRAVPKELSPGPSRSPLVGFNYGLGRANSFLNNFAQGYNIGSVGGYNVRMDRFSPLASGRSGFSPFNSPGYGMGLNLDPGMSPNYGGASNFGNSLAYGRMLTPYIGGNSSRYNSPIGYNGANARNDSVLGSTARNLWGNSGLNNASNTANTAGNLGSGSGNYGVSLGGENWGLSINSQNRGSASSFASGNISYGSGDSNYGVGGGGYGRNTGSGGAPTSALVASSGSFEGSYGDLYHTGSVYGDSTWRSSTPELDRSGSLGYGIDNMASDVNARTSEDYIGNYGISSRQSNRGNNFSLNRQPLSSSNGNR